MDDELKRRFDAMMQRINDNHEIILSQLRDIRSELPAMRAYVGARAGETELLMQRLFDRLNDRLDQTERSVEERLRKLEGGS
jgi:hypothetical protein